ncbi:MAG TPA: tetratricopeptide repeat protein [bacterium]|nr:tetratricopeptide repeat protein [bacterium]HPN42255.1 tetratricopeptide repeat protein [bacterium]
MGRMETVKKISGETEWLQKRLDDNPHSILFARLADRYLDAGDINRAMEICNKGLEYYPGYSTGLFVYAKCLLRKTEYEEAEKQLKKVIALNPGNLLALKLYGDLMAEMGWSRTAEECYKKIMDLDPLEMNVRTSIPGSLGYGEKKSVPKIPGKEPEENLGIDDKSIDNLFRNNVSANEADESIDSLFGGNIDDQVETLPEPVIPKSNEREELSHETVDSLFGSGEDTIQAPPAPPVTTTNRQSWDEFNDDSIISLFEKEPEPFAQSATPSSVYKDKPASKDNEPVDEDMFLFGRDDEEEPAIATGKSVSEPLFPQTGMNEEDEQDLIFPVTEAEKSQQEDFAFPDAGQDDFQFTSQATTQAKDNNRGFEEDEDSFIVGEDEEEEDYSYSPEKTKPERDRYSNILDGIFSPGLDDEERKDMETRSKLGAKGNDSEFSVAEEIDQDIFGMGDESSKEETELFSAEEELEEETDLHLEPEDTILLKGDEARFAPSQPDEEEEEEAFSIPDISEGYLTFEEDENEENIETEAVHMPDADMTRGGAEGGFEAEEEELGNFLAGLGGQDDLEELPELDEDLFAGKETDSQPVVERPGVAPVKQPPAEKDAAGAAPKDKFVTPTLGEIYAAQGQYSKAISVFELLLEKSPDNEFYKSKLEYLKKKQSEENN